jgi:murein DD-endopeptidase MepM/ murein hydrolase activator NlpD
MPGLGGFRRPKRLRIAAVLAALAGAILAQPAPAQVNDYAIAPASRLVHLSDGGTLAGADINAAVDALNPVFPPRDIKAGQEIVLDVAGALREIRFSAGRERDFVVRRTATGFTAKAQPRSLAHVPELAAGVIRTNLFEAAGSAGVPMPVLQEMIRAFSYDVDFQRDLQPNDSFEILFERLYDARGHAVGTGDIVYAALTLSGRTERLYRYIPAGAGTAEFYTAAGASAKKALLRTPVDGARLSSGFGLRLHPILGYTKMHRGIDFAAPPGTPVMAASDGIVEEAGASGSYGNLVVIHHAGAYETAYAHMSRIARSLRPGTPVRQGEVIGFVGATGRATGPHLHFELRVKGEPVNPMSVKSEPHQALAERDLPAFHAVVAAVNDEVLQLRAATLVAGLPAHRVLH